MRILDAPDPVLGRGMLDFDVGAVGAVCFLEGVEVAKPKAHAVDVQARAERRSALFKRRAGPDSDAVAHAGDFEGEGVSGRADVVGVVYAQAPRPGGNPLSIADGEDQRYRVPEFVGEQVHDVPTDDDAARPGDGDASGDADPLGGRRLAADDEHAVRRGRPPGEVGFQEGQHGVLEDERKRGVLDAQGSPTTVDLFVGRILESAATVPL